MDNLGDEELGLGSAALGGETLLTGDALTGAVHERWAVKTGSDPGAHSIDAKKIAPTTIAALRSVPVPADIRHARNPDGGVETTIWAIDATLVGYKLEGDQDYHLVLSDANNQTMIAEIPNPTAVDAGSPFLSKITAARKSFSDRFQLQIAALAELIIGNEVPMIVGTRVPVHVEGIGFFDFIHGQTGVAPNGVELHPVLSITFP